MSLIKIKNLSYTYEGSYVTVFEDVALDLDSSWKLGLVGRNGRGKTTFLKLLAGKLDAGDSIITNLNFDYFPYECNNHKVMETLIEDLLGEDFWRIYPELNGLALQETLLSKDIGTLSPGEKTKLMLAAMFARPNNFLLLDEPTNHLDLAARAQVAAYLRGKQGFILASHDRALLDLCTDHTLGINKKSISVSQGSYSVWFEETKKREDAERKRNLELNKQVSRLKNAVAATSSWADKIEKSKNGNGPCDRGYIGHQSAKMMKRSKAIEKRRLAAVSQKEKLLTEVETAFALKFNCRPFYKEKLLEARGLAIGFARPLFTDLNFSLFRNQQLAVTGSNGSGKTTLLKAVATGKKEYGGCLELASGLKISYIPQDVSYLKAALKDFAAAAGLEIPLFFAILNKLGLESKMLAQPLETYSEGQKKKVLLAKSLAESADLYIWDEPLNYLDIYCRISIEQAIVDCRPTMLIVEHDEVFLRNIGAKIIKLD